MGAGGSTSHPETPEEKRERERFMNSLRVDVRYSSYFAKEVEKPEKENKLRLQALAKLTEEEKEVLGL